MYFLCYHMCTMLLINHRIQLRNSKYSRTIPIRLACSCARNLMSTGPFWRRQWIYPVTMQDGGAPSFLKRFFPTSARTAAGMPAARKQRPKRCSLDPEETAKVFSTTTTKERSRACSWAVAFSAEWHTMERSIKTASILRRIILKATFTWKLCPARLMQP